MLEIKRPRALDYEELSIATAAGGGNAEKALLKRLIGKTETSVRRR